MLSELEKKLKEKRAKQKTTIAKIKKWSKRMDKINDRKENPMSDAAFCRKYELNTARFNSLKNLKFSSLPTEKLLNQVENAFKAEGV